MAFALLIVFMFVAYGLTTLFRRWLDVPTLIGVAIGCAVNANLFTPLNYPVVVGELTFSIESILYTLFMYTVVIRILDYSYDDAKKLALTSVAAIIISAIIELVALLAKDGFQTVVFQNFAVYLFSSIGTIIGVWLMVFFTIGLKKRRVSSYIIIPIVMAVSCIIHALVYYGGMSLVFWEGGIYTFKMALGTIIGKAACIGLGVLCYFINQKFWKPLNLVSKKEEENK